MKIKNPLRNTLLVVSAAVSMLSGCVAQHQVSNEGKTLHAQAPGAPAHSALNTSSLISPAHRSYRDQPNPVSNAFRGAIIGGTAGNIIGEDTEGAVYGAAAGGLIGYGSGIY